MTDCAHPQTVLLKLDCGPGGIQYRRYCTTCWRSTTHALPHGKVQEELRGGDVPLADRNLIDKAAEAYWRRSLSL
jgi:hypothetical protein